MSTHLVEVFAAVFAGWPMTTDGMSPTAGKLASRLTSNWRGRDHTRPQHRIVAEPHEIRRGLRMPNQELLVGGDEQDREGRRAPSRPQAIAERVGQVERLADAGPVGLVQRRAAPRVERHNDGSREEQREHHAGGGSRKAGRVRRPPTG